MICKNCKQEIDNKADVCVHCGCKVKKPIYKKWWFWCIIVIVVVVVASGSGDEKTSTSSSQTSNNVSQKAEEVIAYEAHELKTMIDDLKSNALKAESKYKNKYVEITGKIDNFDSDGQYISVKPTNASDWDFDSAMCYINNDEQKNFLIEKSVGDVITIKGKVKSVGEVLGYSIDISEVK